MHDLDFHGLVDEIGDAARQPEFAAVRRRTWLRTRQRRAMAGAAFGVAALLALGGYAITRPGGGPVGPAEASPSAVVEAPERIHWATARDADHLYAQVADCASCRPRLMASDDGGRTWQERPAYAALKESASLSDLIVLGPRILALGLPAKLGRNEKDSGAKRKISTDGGATWRDLRVSPTPVSAAPAGTWLVDCFTDGCGLHAVDAATGTLAPLATQPALAQYVTVDAPVGAGLWVKGLDPATGRPAVAVSRDRGQTWTVTVFTTESPAPSPDGRTPRRYLPDIATADGRTVYTTIERTDDGFAHLYRSTDGGATWQRTNPDGPPSGLPFVTTSSFVTADGAHVMVLQEGDTSVAWISSDGRTYAPLAVAGAPAKSAILPTVIDKDHYLWHDGQALYLSEDGRSWRRLTTP